MRHSNLPAALGAVLRSARCIAQPLATASPLRDTRLMRAIGLLLALAIVGLGLYFYLKQMPTTDPGTAPTQAIDLAGVRMDLLQIAQAERTHIAMNSQCASLDDLISSHSVSMQRPEREGYSYTIDCSSTDFTVTARHTPAPAGSPIRYPTLAVDQSLQVRELN